ncbi:BTAD domain-containing putative transcriptional regulator [Actinomadura kijaniata]|uniref:BTAD domain-containing putative transcriptional regulator n=1 Tax=Actinomadura kijaniata TaxID=46161 RepID=UPI000832CBDD|nr:BTAD domain-containing putative transcriptional regulator [Actinomadura kijaniata]
MRFGVLGPLAVWTSDGEPVRIPETKVRALLADLLAHRGRAVSADRLVEDLWGEDPPGSPSGTLRAKVSQLRRALGDRDLVVHQAPGYVLRDADVDADRFEELTRRARGAGDARVRADLLAEALDLWRGPAFADFADEEFARPEARRLEEARLTALEELAECRLDLGEPVDVGALVAEHPLRERLRAAHIRALYRAGRQSEALASYEEIRTLLRDELGLDPGPELTALHQAILRQDPALAPRRPRSNLPAPLTELIGRDDAVRAVRRLLDGGRLVTLTGTGGVGKTRLALEAAARSAEAFPGGAWLVELAPLDGCAETLAEAVAAVLGVRDVPDPGGRPLLDRVVEALRGAPALLVLDNCEHLVEPVAELAAALLRAAPDLRILATSQEPLSVAGELRWPVPPLEPDNAARLFAARARAAAPHAALDADAVAAICRRLDGIPLALELAATRLRVLNVRDLADRLDDRFRLLTGANRAAPPRQRTLRAMIDWSWEPLTEAERTVLRRLAVHADGCALDTAEQVCSGDGVRPDEVLDLLGRLVERSLVVPGEDGTRYRLLESVAAYGLERLAEAGETDRVRARHLACFVALAERADPLLRGGDQRAWLARLDAESADLRAALDTAVRTGDAESALRLVNALGWYWFLRGRLGEARRSFTRALEAAGDAPEAVRATALAWRAAMALLILDGADPDPFEQVDAALARLEAAGDPAALAWARWFLGRGQLGFGNSERGLVLIERALADFEELGDRWGIAAALSVRAELRTYRTDLGAIERDGRRAMELFRELGDRWGELQVTFVLGERAEVAGDYAEAARLRTAGLRIAEELGLWSEMSGLLARLGRIALLTGDLDRSRDLHQRAKQVAAERSHQRGEEFAEVGLALVARRQGRLDDAERHLTAWIDWCRQWEGDGGLAFILAELGFIAELRGDAERALAFHTEGLVHAERTGDRRAYALACEGLAGAHSLAGDHERAARLLAEAHAARAAVGAPLPEAERGDVDRIARRVRAALGPGALTTAEPASTGT